LIGKAARRQVQSAVTTDDSIFTFDAEVEHLEATGQKHYKNIFILEGCCQGWLLSVSLSVGSENTLIKTLSLYTV